MGMIRWNCDFLFRCTKRLQSCHCIKSVFQFQDHRTQTYFLFQAARQSRQKMVVTTSDGSPSSPSVVSTTTTTTDSPPFLSKKRASSSPIVSDKIQRHRGSEKVEESHYLVTEEGESSSPDLEFLEKPRHSIINEEAAGGKKPPPPSPKAGITKKIYVENFMCHRKM
jgi:hypothetical protein